MTDNIGRGESYDDLDDLAVTVERLGAARSISRRLRALAEEAPTITHEQLADRLAALADRLAVVTPTVRFPVDQVVHFDAMATVDTIVWRCRICGQEGTARTTLRASRDALTHLGADHGGVADPR